MAALPCGSILCCWYGSSEVISAFSCLDQLCCGAELNKHIGFLLIRRLLETTQIGHGAVR